MNGRRAFLAGTVGALGAGSLPARALAAFSTPITAQTTIGVVGPFTGDQARAAEQIANGVRQACDESNLLKGTLDRAFTLRTFDDQNALATAIEAAQFAIDDPSIVCVIGHLSGKITQSVLRTYAISNMPVIVPASTVDAITEQGFGNVLRLSTKDVTEGQLAGQYAADTLKPASAVAVTQDGDYGSDAAAGFIQAMQRAKIDAKAVVISYDKPDFTKAAAQIVSVKPGLVYLAGLTRDLGPLVETLRAAGYTGPLHASQGFFDPQTIPKYKTLVEGLTIASSMPPLQLAPTVLRIKTDYEQRYGPISPLAAFSYAAAQIAITVMKDTGANDRLAVGRALGIPNATYHNTMIGDLTFGVTGDPQDPNVYFYTVTNGAWRYARAAHPNGFIFR